ncbi:MAG: gliding motility-associated C-terminal domain-containing protein [Treponema sp.]|nr:gliding motility-associated C-terminal domain-containing protein [Treponema sp.]
MKKQSIISILLILILTSGFVFAKPKYISPNNDGIQDEIVIPISISDKRYVQGWSLVILDENKNIVRTIENKIALPQKLGFKMFFKQLIAVKQGVPVPESITWNGVLDNGETAPDGLYYWYITATDDNGNVGQTKEHQVYVDTVAPEIELTQPSDKIFGEGAKATLKIKQEGSVEDEWIGVFKTLDAEGKEKVVKTYKWTNSEPEEFIWKGTDDDDVQISDGVYSYEITATDRAGNVAPHTVISNIIYSAEKPATNIFIDGSRYFSPKTDSKLSEITLNLTIPVPEEKSGNKLTEWAVTIENKAGKVVKTYNQSNYGAIPPAKLEFRGLDDSDKLLEDGEYQAFVTAKYLNGYVPAKLASPVFVLDTEKPAAQVRPSDKVFGAGSKADVKFSIMITPSVGSPVPSWRGEIKTADGGKIVKTYDFGEYPPESVVWNGLNQSGKISEKGDYKFTLTATDMAGNAGVAESQTITFDTTETQLLLAVNDSAFSPNGDKVKDTLVFNPVTQTNDVVSYEFVIKDKDGKAVYTKKENKKLPSSFTWNGNDSDNTRCEDGFYSAQLSVTAANGSTAAAATQSFELDTKAPSLVAEIPWNYFSPDNDGNQDNIPISISESTNEKVWNAEVRNAKNNVVKKLSWNGKKTSLDWDGTDESGNLAADGKYSIVISSTDDAGNSFSTSLKEIVLDNRETKLYLTSEYDGISPNDDNYLDQQIFAIRTSVAEDLKSWNFDIRKEDGNSVFSLSEKDSMTLPAEIKWNGADKNGIACEGTFTGTLNVVYKKGNRVSAVSSPFICTATPPELRVQTAPAYFSPDNDGIDDDLFIKLTGSTKAKIKNWSFVIRDPKGKVFWKTEGKSTITERIIWDGLSNVQKDASGHAERVQSAMDYSYAFTVSDNLGMKSIVEGIIPVDVLVIREGNVLKMAVPSIIFESDAANFQSANEKLTAEQVQKNVEILGRIAEILKKFPDYQVTIQGHANRLSDNVDEETVDNPRVWGRALGPLSKERADAIKAYLVKKGVNANSITTEGMGGTKPVVDPKDSDNNWKNRRVEFILVK